MSLLINFLITDKASDGHDVLDRALAAAAEVKVREDNRCKLCGRARGYMRKFSMCRICFREQALKGIIPGVMKSSW